MLWLSCQTTCSSPLIYLRFVLKSLTSSVVKSYWVWARRTIPYKDEMSLVCCGLWTYITRYNGYILKHLVVGGNLVRGIKFEWAIYGWMGSFICPITIYIWQIAAIVKCSMDRLYDVRSYFRIHKLDIVYAVYHIFRLLQCQNISLSSLSPGFRGHI